MSEVADLRKQFEIEPTATEKALWDVFVTEYCKDFNPIQAACRTGFNLTFAIEYSQIFMSKPYVQRAIMAYKTSLPPEDDQDETARDKTRIVNALRRAIDSEDLRASVAAAKTLAGIRGLDQAPDRTGDELDKVVEAFKKIAQAAPD